MTGLLSVPVAIPAPPCFDSVRGWLSQCCRVLILQSTAEGVPCCRCVVTLAPSGRVFSGKFHHPFPEIRSGAGGRPALNECFPPLQSALTRTFWAVHPYASHSR